jgi:hypothetical protein
MQASIELQRRKEKANLQKAGGKLIEAITHLRSQPRTLALEQTLLPSLAWTMIQLGMAKQCRQALVALPAKQGRQKKRNAPALVALSLCDVALGKKVGKAVARDLDSMGLNYWNKRLMAMRLEKDGRLKMARSLLQGASFNTKDPSLVFDIAKLEIQLGNQKEIMRSLRELEHKLWTPRMDNPRVSPLLSPKRSYILYKIQRLDSLSSAKKD